MNEETRLDQTVRITIPAEGLEKPESAINRCPTTKHASEKMSPANLGPAAYKLYNEFMQSIYDAVIIADMDGNVIDGNDRAVEFLHYEISELRNLTVFQIICGFDRSVLKKVSQNIDNEKFTVIEAYCSRSDKTTFPSEIATSKLHLGAEKHIYFFIRDITKRKEDERILQETQTQLIRAERMELAGNIAGHIAHDFNNLLTPLLAYPDLIEEQLPKNSQARKDLKVIKKMAQQMADINRQLLGLSRRGHFKQSVLNINSIIENVVALIQRGGGAVGVEIKRELADDLINIRGVPEQLLRVIQNICRNAIDAMDDKGTLLIKTENVYLETPLKRYESIREGEYIKFMVLDTGHGIPLEIMDKIFDPFFTTKPADSRRGSGLGLSVVHGVVKDHKGYIDVESKVGRGTTFTLYFPTCHEDLKMDTGKVEHQGGMETILVVDDDSLQVEVISRIVANLGYTAVGVQSGEEAIAIVRKCKTTKEFPVLTILDIVMPGMDGIEIYKYMKTINPRQKTIFISGQTESAKVSKIKNNNMVSYLRKPISIETLCQAIKHELDRSVKDSRK